MDGRGRTFRVDHTADGDTGRDEDEEDGRTGGDSPRSSFKFKKSRSGISSGAARRPGGETNLSSQNGLLGIKTNKRSRSYDMVAFKVRKVDSRPVLLRYL